MRQTCHVMIVIKNLGSSLLDCIKRSFTYLLLDWLRPTTWVSPWNTHLVLELLLAMLDFE